MIRKQNTMYIKFHLRSKMNTHSSKNRMALKGRRCAEKEPGKQIGYAWTNKITTFQERGSMTLVIKYMRLPAIYELKWRGLTAWEQRWESWEGTSSFCLSQKMEIFLGHWLVKGVESEQKVESSNTAELKDCQRIRRHNNF